MDKYGAVITPELSGPARDLWIEIDNDGQHLQGVRSGPARDLWIEISPDLNNKAAISVGSRKGPVD